MSTTPDMDSTIRQIVADVLEVDPTEITDTSAFADQHGADSLRAIEILARVERALSVQIPQEELANMVNLASVRRIVQASPKAAPTP